MRQKKSVRLDYSLTELSLKFIFHFFSYRNRLPSVSCFSFIVFGSWRLENICFSHFWKSGLCKGMWEFSSLNGEFRKSLIHKWVRLLGLNSLDLCKRKTLGTLLTALADVSAEIKSRCSLLVKENYICMTLEVKKKIFGTQNLLSRSIRDNESSVEILLHLHTKATPNSRMNRMKLDAIFKLSDLINLKSIPCIPFCSVDTLICQCLLALFIVSYLYLTNVDTSVARDQSFFRLWSVVFKDNLLPQGRLGPVFVSGWPCSSQGTRLKELDSSIVNKSKLRKKINLSWQKLPPASIDFDKFLHLMV